MIITPKKDYEKLTNGSDKKVDLKCDKCGKITHTTYNNYVQSQRRRDWPLTTYCKKCCTKISGKARRGKYIAWNKGKKLDHLSRENSSSWKGGTYISSDGYKMIYVNNDDKKIKWNNYRKEHLVIIEQEIKRDIKKGEVVHHVDCDKLNNSPTNLDLLSSEKEHRQSHLSLEQIAVELLQAGHIQYNNGKYVAKEKVRELLEHPEEGNQQPSLVRNNLKGSTTSSES